MSKPTISKDLYAELQAQEIGDCLPWTQDTCNECAARIWYYHKKHPERLHRYIAHKGTTYIIRLE